jgi:hypothetical protein
MEGRAVQHPLFDDIDRLFARAGTIDPPHDLLDRVMAETRSASRAPRLALLYLTTYLLALAGLGLFAYELGAAAVRSGMSALVSALIGDVTLLAEAPAAYVGALLTSIPWAQAVGLLIDLAILVIVTRLLLSEVASGPERRNPPLQA